MFLATQNHPGLAPLLTGLSATGSSQSTALALVAGASHEFTTVASSTGAVLPVPKQFPCTVTVTNAGANALSVYPPSGGTVAGGSTGAAYSLSASTTATFYASSLLNYYLESISAGSGGSGTVTSVSVTTANGLSGSVATATSTPAISLALASPTGAAGVLYATSGGTITQAADILVGSAGQLSQAAIAAPGTLTLGDRWIDTTQNTEAVAVGGMPSYRHGMIFSQATKVTVAASGTTTLLSTTNAAGSLSLPAGCLNQLRRVLRFRLGGYGTTPASAQGNCYFQCKLGSSVVATTSGGNMVASATNAQFLGWFEIRTGGTGTSGKLDATGALSTQGSVLLPATTLVIGNYTSAGLTAPQTQVTLDLTQAYTIDFDVNLTGSSTSITLANFVVELDG